MREARRNIQHLPVLGRQRFTDERTVRLGTEPQVDGDVERAAARDADEFRLRVRLRLIMEPAQHAFGGPAQIVLHEFGRDAVFRELVLAVAFVKKAARIPEQAGVHEQDAFYLRRNEIQD